MKRMKSIGYILCGVLIGGVLLNGDATNAVAGLMAERSSQPIYVDGQKVELEAYNIAGSNYVKLRDVGKAVGFNVSWDGSAVQIDSDAPYEDDSLQAAAPLPQSDRRVTLPADGSKYVPQVGDLIPCDDGTLYEVKDVERWESNVFMDGPMPEMPTPTCDWSLFPELELPKVEARHYSDDAGDDLFVRNLHELRRMQYTLYNAIGREDAAWSDGKPLGKVIFTIPAEYEAYTGHFWPWRSSELEKHVNTIPRGRFRIDSWDYYHNGVFMDTRYYICTI